jgi:DNA invertase Pin-like site-specific DNA recombinase
LGFQLAKLTAGNGDFLAMAIHGYARVSTGGQSLDSQLEQLTAAGCGKIYQEKISGKNAQRPQLQRLMFQLAEGDTLIVTRLDRLARSTLDLLSILKAVGDRGAAFRSLADGWANTDSAHGRLFLTILGALAEFERELIRDRTREGQRRARAAGVKFGRKSKMTAAQRQEALQRLRDGETLEAVGKRFGVHFSTISRLRQQKLSIPDAIAAHGNGLRRGH